MIKKEDYYSLDIIQGAEYDNNKMKRSMVLWTKGGGAMVRQFG